MAAAICSSTNIHIILLKNKTYIFDWWEQNRVPSLFTFCREKIVCVYTTRVKKWWAINFMIILNRVYTNSLAYKSTTQLLKIDLNDWRANCDKKSLGNSMCVVFFMFRTSTSWRRDIGGNYIKRTNTHFYKAFPLVSMLLWGKVCC